MDSKMHSLAHERSNVQIEEKEGGLFASHGKYIKGRTLRLLKIKMTAQRNADWQKSGWNDFYWKPWKSYLAMRAKNL